MTELNEVHLVIPGRIVDAITCHKRRQFSTEVVVPRKRVESRFRMATPRILHELRAIQRRDDRSFDHVRVVERGPEAGQQSRFILRAIMNLGPDRVN